MRRATPYLFLVPALLVLLIVIGYPIVSNVWMSLHNVRLLRGMGGEFVGGQNYEKLLDGPEFWRSVKISLLFAFTSLPVAFVLSLVLALSLNEIGRSRPIFMGILLIPWAISPVVTGYMWRWLFNDTFGLVNHLLSGMGLIDHYLPWLAVPGTAIAATVVANIWRFLPYMSIMLLAGLQGIPHDLYEAADVDGASTIHKFLWITLSELRPVVVVVLLFSTIWMVNDFAMIFIMTEGGPAKATQVLPITIYRMAFEALRFGRGAAASVMLLVFLLTLSLFSIRRLFGREEMVTR